MFNWKIFVRVLKSYSIEERVVSVVLAGLVVVFTVQGVMDIFKSPDLFLSENSYFTQGIVSDNSTLINPVYADYSDANRSISSLVFSGLTKYDPHVKAFVEDLATLTISADKKTYHFVIKDNLLWHDGVPLTADDVYFTFHDLIQSPDFKNPLLRVNFDGVKINMIDQKTIEFTLNSPNAFFITNLSVGILPKHLLAAVPVADFPFNPFNFKPVGSGPYKVDQPMENLPDGRQRVILTVFDGYYGQHPKIKNVRFNIYPTADLLIKEKNALNVVAKVSKDFSSELEATNRFKFSTYELPQYTAVFINTDSGILKKYKVRLALQKAIDKNALLKTLTNKTAVDTPLLELQQSDWIYKPNLDEAKGALFDSGYKVDKNAKDQFRRDAKGNPLKLVLLARAYDKGTALFDETTRVTDFLKNSWAQIGLNVDVQFEAADVFNERISKRDYDLLLTGQSLGYNLDTYSFWHSSQISVEGLNLSNYRSFAADALIEKIRDTFDLDEKARLLKDLAKNIAEDIPAIFLYSPTYIFANDGKVQGVSLENLAFPSDRFAHIADWCIVCK